MYADERPASLAARAVSSLLWGNPQASPLVEPHPRAGLPLAQAARCGHLLECALAQDQRTYCSVQEIAGQAK